MQPKLSSFAMTASTPRTTARGVSLLLLASGVWGTAFVAQRMGMDYLGPFAFNAARFLIGGLVLVPFMLWGAQVRRRMLALSHRPSCHTKSDLFTQTDSAADAEDEARRRRRRELLWGALCCGTALGAVVSLQQAGLVYTTVGKAGFITALYIVFVPILGIFLGRKVSWLVWACISLAVVGMYLLCMKDSVGLGRGDTLVLLCAVASAVHILLIAHFAPRVDGVWLSCFQFFVCSALSTVLSLIAEETRLEALLRGWGPVLYTGLLSCGVGFTLQTLGQRDVNPVIASLILSLEAVFAVVSAWLILGEVLFAREVWGCVLIFTAVIVAQIPEFSAFHKREQFKSEMR